MNVEYKAKITGDMSGLEKVLKAANGSMKQLTDKDFIIKLNYDGNVKALNKTLTDAVKACPELAIQFQYDVNKKALEQKFNEIKNLETLQADIDTGKVQRKIREMVSEIETGFNSQLIPDDELKKKIEELYKYANSAAKAGENVAINFEQFEDIDQSFDGLLTKLSKTPQYFGDMSKGISGALEQTKSDISEIQKQLDYFKSKGAVDMTEGFDKTEEEIDETSKKLKELVDGFEAYYKKKKGLNAGNYWKQLKQQIDDGDESLKGLLSDLKLLDDEKLNLITAGAKNQGGIIGAERVAIARKNDNNQYEDTLALKKALDEAYDAGVNVARIMDVIGDESRETFVEIQERATGKMLGAYGVHTESGLPEVNPDFLEATDEQIQKLIKDIFTLQKLGINAEAHPENLIYDKLKGFQFIDLDLKPASYINSAEMIEDAAIRIAGDVEDMYDELGDAKGLKAVQNFGDKFRNIGAAMAEVVDAAEKATEEAQDSHSPSKVAEKLGEKWSIGYAEGIKKHKADVEDAVRELVQAGELTMRDLVEDLPNIVGKAEYVDLENPVKNILANGKESAVSPTQTFDNEIQKNLTYLENYKNTIKEIDRLKLEPETEETRKKLEELNTLADYFASHITVIRSENQGEVDRSMMRFGYDWNENLRRNYTEEQRKAFYEIAGEKTGLRTNQEVPQFHYIKDELKSIESQSEKTRQSLNETLANSASYVKRLRSDFLDLIDTKLELKVETNKRDIELYEKDIANILKKYPELEQFLDKFTSFGAAKKFAQSDEWNDFLATLPQAHAYLESIGYDFERVNDQTSGQPARELLTSEQAFAQYGESLDEVAKKSQYTKNQLEELYKSGRNQMAASSAVDVLAEAYESVSKASEKASSDIGDATDSIKKEGQAAEESARKKDKFTKANREAAKSGEETAKSAKKAADAVKEEGKVLKDNSDLAKWLSEVQSGIKTIEFDVSLNKEMAEAEIKKISATLAEEYNKAYGTNVTGAQVTKAYKASLKERQDAEEAELQKHLGMMEERTQKDNEAFREQINTWQRYVREGAEKRKEVAELRAKEYENIFYSGDGKLKGVEFAPDTEALRNSNALYDELEAIAKRVYDLKEASLKLDSETLVGSDAIAKNEAEIAELSQKALNIYREINEAEAVQESRENALLEIDKQREGVLSNMLLNQELQSRDDMTSQVGKWITQVEVLRQSGKYTQEFTQELNNALSALKSFDSATGSIEEVNTAFEKLEATMKDINSSKGLSEFKRAQESSIAKLNLQIEEFMRKNSRMGSDFQKRFADLKLNWDTESSLGEVQALVAEFAKLKAEVTAAGKTGASFFDTLRQRAMGVNAQLIAQYLSWQDIIRYIRTAAQAVIELDSALTEMRKVSDESLSSLKGYQNLTFDIAGDIGTTGLELQRATADWMRLGESMEDASESAKASTVLMNVSEFENINDATQALVSASQAYKELDKMDIVDVINNIGNNYAVATDELAQGLQNSAAVLKTQGNDLYEAVALLTAGNAITQDISKVAAGTRTIALRLAGTEEAKDELIQLGEDVDDMIVGTRAKMQGLIKDYTAVASNAYEGIDILDANGNLRDTYDILLDIAKVYQEIIDEDKKAGTNRAQALVEAIAGKNRSNIAASILLNPDLLESAYKTAKDSAGSAQEELDKYLESLKGHLKEFNNATQEFFHTLIDSGMLGDIIDFGTAFIKILTEIIDKLGTIPSLGLGIGVRQLMLHFDKIPELSGKVAEVIGGLAKTSAEAQKAVTFDNATEATQEVLLNLEGLEGVFGRVVEETKEMSPATEAALRNISKLEGSFSPIGNAAEEVAESTAEIGSAADNASVGGVAKLASAFKALVPILTNPITIMGALAVATYALYKWVDEANDRQREKIEGLQKEFDGLDKQLKSTNSELTNVEKQIEEIQGKGTISLVEQQELDRLRTQAELLKIARMEQEELLKLKAQELTSENAKLFNNVYGDINANKISNPEERIQGYDQMVGNQVKFSYGEQLSSALESAAKGDYNDSLNELLAIFQQIQEAREGALKTIEEYGSKVTKLNEEELAAFEGAKEVIADTDQYMSGLQIQIGKVKTELLNMKESAGRAGTAEGDALVEQINSALKLVYQYSDTGREWNAMQIGSIFDNSELEKTRQELEAMAAAGELNESTLSQYPKLRDAISQLDLILGNGETAFSLFKNELLATAEAAKQANEELNNAQESVKSWASERDAALTKLGMASESNGEVTYDESWTKYLETIKQLNPELASNQEEVEKCALANLQFSHAVDDLSKNFDSYKSALQDANALTPEYSNAINALADDLTYLTGINFSISEASDFLADANNLELLEKAINGSDEALQQLQQHASQSIRIKIDTQSLTELRTITTRALQNVKDELTELSKGGNVDLTLRPKIDTQLLRDVGWDKVEEVAGEYATVFTKTFSNEAGDVAVNFTPIIVDENGNYVDVMEPDALTEYAEAVIAGTQDDYLKLQIGAEFTGEDAIDQAEAAAIRIHNLHELQIELGLDTTEFNSQFTGLVDWLETADLGTLEAQTYINEDPFIQALIHLANESEEMAAKIKQIFAELGWDIKWDIAKMKVPTSQQWSGLKGDTVHVSSIYGPNGAQQVNWKYEEMDVPTNIRFERNGGAGGRRSSTSGYTPRSMSPSQKSGAASNIDKANGGGGGGGSDTQDKEDDYKETVDFFERLIKVLDQQIDLLDAHLQDVVGSFAKNMILDAEEEAIKKKMAGYSSAIEMYSAKASEALSKIPGEVAEKLQNGAVAIDEFVGESNKDVVDAINDYEGWADKIAECKQQIVELREALRQLELQKFQNIAQDFQELFDVRNTQIDLISKAITLFETDSTKVVGRGFYDAQIEQTEKQLTDLYAKHTALSDQMTKAIASGVNVAGDEWFEMVNAIESVNGEILEAQTRVEQYKNSIIQLYVEAFEREATRYTNLIGIRQKTISALENQISLLESQGYIADRRFYDKQIEQTEASIVDLEEERNALVDRLNKGMANGIKKGSDEWYKMVDAINAVDDQIQKSKISVEQYKDAIIKTYTALFERAQKVYTDQQSVRESALSKMGNENSILEAQGYIASRGVYAAQLDTTQKSISSLEQERVELTNKLNDAMKNGVKEGSEEWLKMVTAIDGVDESIQKAKLSEIELNNAIKKTYTDLFDRDQQLFENQVGELEKSISATSNEISKIEAQGFIASEDLYRSQLSQTQDVINTKLKERQTLTQDLQDAMNAGIKEGSAEWLKMVSAIEEVDAAIQQSELSEIELNEAIKKTYVERFSRDEKNYAEQIGMREKAISAVSNEISYIESQGFIASAKLYESQIAQTQKNLGTLEQKRASLVSKMNTAIAKGVKEGSDEWLNMVKSINAVDEDIQKAKISVENLKDSIIKTYTELFKREEKNFSNQISMREKAISATSNQISMLEAQGFIASAKLYESQIKQTQKNLVALEQERAALVDKMNTAMANGVKEGSDEWLEMVNSINAVDENIQKAKISVENLKDSIIKTYTELFKREEENFSKQISMREKAISATSNQISLLEAQGFIASRKLYDAQIESTKKNIASLEQERIALVKSLNEAMANGVKEGSDEWLEMINAINGVDESIQKANLSVEELKNNVIKTYTELFKREEKNFSDLISMREKAISASNNQIAMLEAQGFIASRKLYDAQMAETQKNIVSLEKERIALVKSLNDAMNNGVKEGSDEWLEMINAINGVDESIQKANLSVEELKNNIAQTYKSLFDREEKTYSRQLETRERALSAIGQQIKFLEEQGYMANRAMYERQIAQTQGSIDVLERERIALVNRLDDAMANGVKKGTDEWYDMVTAIGDVDSKIQESQYSILQYKNSITEMYSALFDRAAEQAANQISVWEMATNALEKQISVAESAGELPGVSLYQQQLEEQQKTMVRLEKERAELMKRMSTATANGIKVGSEKWLSMVKALNSVDEAINDCVISTNELKDAILAINDATFDRIQNRFSAFQTELSNMIDMFSDEDVATEDNRWTKAGLTQLGLAAEQYEIAKTSASQYGKQIEELNKNYADGKYSVTEYTEKLADLQQKQWESVKAAESAKKAMLELNKARVDIAVEGINKEKDAYTKLIDEQKKALQSEKDLNDYKRSVEDANKDISAIERQLAALQDDQSASANARRLKLESELSEARQKLADIEADHQYQTATDALDKQAEDYEAAKDAEIETLQNSLEQEELILTESYERIKENAALIGEEILLKAQELGIQMSTELTAPWDNGILAIAAFSENLAPATSALMEQLQFVIDKEWDLQNQADLANLAISTIFGQQSDALVGEIGESILNLQAEEEAANNAAATVVNLFEQKSDVLREEIGKAITSFEAEEAATQKAAEKVANLFGKTSEKLCGEIDNATDALKRKEDQANYAAEALSRLFDLTANDLTNSIRDANEQLAEDESAANRAANAISELFKQRASELADSIRDANEQLAEDESAANRAAREVSELFRQRASELADSIRDANEQLAEDESAANRAAREVSDLFKLRAGDLTSSIKDANKAFLEEEIAAQKAADKVADNFRQSAERLWSQISQANTLLEDEEGKANNALLKISELFSQEATDLISDLGDINEKLGEQETAAETAASDLADLFSKRADGLIQTIKDAREATSNLNTAADIVGKTLDSSIDGTYSGKSAVDALGAIEDAADGVKSAAEDATKALGDMISKMNDVPSDDEPNVTSIYGGPEQGKVAVWQKNPDGTTELIGFRAHGSKGLPHDEVSWTQENGPEAIVNPATGAILTPLEKGSAVLPTDQTKNIWEWSRFNPEEFASRLAQKINSTGKSSVQTNTMQVGSLVQINGNVNDTQEMVMIAAQQASTKIKQSFRELSNGLTG